MSFASFKSSNRISKGVILDILILLVCVVCTSRNFRPVYYLYHQCLITPATMNKFVMRYTSKIPVRMKAILSASSFDLPAFSPSAFAQRRHISPKDSYSIYQTVLYHFEYAHGVFDSLQYQNVKCRLDPFRK